MLLQFRFTQSNFSVLGNHQMSRINVFPFLNIILRFLLYWCHCAESAWECLYDSHNSLLIKMIPKRADAITGIYCTCTCIHFIFRTVTLTVQVTGQLKWKSGNSNHIFLHWKITKLKKKIIWLFQNVLVTVCHTTGPCHKYVKQLIYQTKVRDLSPDLAGQC